MKIWRVAKIFNLLLVVTLLSGCSAVETKPALTPTTPYTEPTWPRTTEVTPGIATATETITQQPSATATANRVAILGRPETNRDASGGVYPEGMWNKIEAGGFAQPEQAIQDFWRYWAKAKSLEGLVLGPNEILQIEYKYDPKNPQDACVVVNIRNSGYEVDGQEIDFISVPYFDGRPVGAAPTKYFNGEIEAGQGPLLLTNDGWDKVNAWQWYLSCEKGLLVRREKQTNTVVEQINKQGAWATAERLTQVKIPQIQPGGIVAVKLGLASPVEEGGLGMVVDEEMGRQKWDDLWLAELNLRYPSAQDVDFWHSGHGENGNYWYFYYLLKDYSRDSRYPTYEELQAYWKDHDYFMPGSVIGKDKNGNPVQIPFKGIYLGGDLGNQTVWEADPAFAGGFYADWGVIMAYTWGQYEQDLRIKQFEQHLTLGRGPQTFDSQGSNLWGMKLIEIGGKKRLVLITGSHAPLLPGMTIDLLGGDDGRPKLSDLVLATSGFDAYVASVLNLRQEKGQMSIPGRISEANILGDNNNPFDSIFTLPK